MFWGFERHITSFFVVLSAGRFLGVLDGFVDSDKAFFKCYPPDEVGDHQQHEYYDHLLPLLAKSEFNSGLRTIVDEFLCEFADPYSGGPCHEGKEHQFKYFVKPRIHVRI